LTGGRGSGSSGSGEKQDEEIANRILLALPRGVLPRIRPHLQPVNLPLGRIIYRADERMEKVYFINRGLVSLIRSMKDGRTVEIGAVGIEGLMGLDALYGLDIAPLECIVQLPGTAFCGSAAALRAEMTRSRSLQTLLQRYYHLMASQMAQTAACNRLHSLEQRCCRWLLIAHDSARSDTFPLTHEFLAMMLGVQRAGVSIAANALQQSGLIRYARGQMSVTDRQGLEAAACECYGTIRHVADRLFLRG
jgi:CRP-like cAMP-binding protein